MGSVPSPWVVGQEAAAVTCAAIELRWLASLVGGQPCRGFPDVLFFQMRKRGACSRLCGKVRGLGTVADFFRHSSPLEVEGLVREVAVFIEQALAGSEAQGGS